MEFRKMLMITLYAEQKKIKTQIYRKKNILAKYKVSVSAGPGKMLDEDLWIEEESLRPWAE